MGTGQGEILFSTSFPPEIADLFCKGEHCHAHFSERWQNKFHRLENVGHVEIYKRGGYAICQLLEFKWEGGREICDSVLDEHILETRHVIALIGHRNMLKTCRLRGNDRESMLVGPIKLIEVEDDIVSGRIPSFVQLGLIDKKVSEARNGWRYNFISLENGTLKFIPFLADGEVGMGIVAPEAPDHGIPQYVECASEVMNHISSNQWHVFWKSLDVDAYEWMSTIKMALFSDRVEIRFGKLGNAILKNLEMLAGVPDLLERGIGDVFRI